MRIGIVALINSLVLASYQFNSPVGNKVFFARLSYIQCSFIFEIGYMRRMIQITICFLAYLYVGSPAIYAQLFTDVALESGIDFTPYVEIYSSGAAVVDYNNDGFEDIYVTGGLYRDALFMNNGDGSFTNMAESAGLGFTENVMTIGVVAADIDNDGFRDIFVTTSFHKNNLSDWASNILLYNNGDGTFTNIAHPSNIGQDIVNSGAASFGDINNDGFLDLYVSSFQLESRGEVYDTVIGAYDYGQWSGSPNLLYVNNGDMTFTNIAFEQNVSDSGFSLATAFVDINNDANVDLYVANDVDGINESTFPNALFKNLHPIESFENIAAESGTDEVNTSMGIAVGDYDENGYFDMYVTYCGRNVLLKNNGDETFDDVTDFAGVGDPDVPVDPMVNNFKTLLYRYTPDDDFIGVDHSSFEICLVGDDTTCHDFDLEINVIDDDFVPGPIVLVGYDSTLQQNVFYSIENFIIDWLERALIWVPGNTSSLICMEIPDSLFFESGYQSTDGVEDVHMDDTILPSSGWGTNFSDFDNDADLDLFVANGQGSFLQITSDNPNSYYENLGNGRFENSSEEAGVLNPWHATGSVLLDYDNDGDEDIFVANLNYSEGFGNGQEVHSILYRNDLQHSSANNWLKVKLEGIASNRDGIGALLKAYVGGRILIRQIDGGSSSQSHNTIIAHFGLRGYTVVDSLEIIWPGGCSQKVYDLDADQFVQVREDCGLLSSEPIKFKDPLNAVIVFPVPADDHLNFQINDAIARSIRIDIYGVDGSPQLLKAYEGLVQPGQNVLLDISELPAGAYFYALKMDGAKYFDQFIIAK